MASKLVPLNFVEGDRLPIVSFEFTGTDVSIPAQFTSITLRVRRVDGTKLSKAAVIDDGPNGLFHFEWAVGDLTEGKHRAEVVFVNPAGEGETFPGDEPLVLDVRGQV